MALLAFLLAAIQFALIGLGVDVFDIGTTRELAVGLFLIALGLLLPGAVTFYGTRCG